MNERIQLLAEQAGIAVWGDAVYMYHPSETLDSTVMTKFAELIVRECSSFLKDTLDDHFAAEQLEEHFGVDE